MRRRGMRTLAGLIVLVVGAAMPAAARPTATAVQIKPFTLHSSLLDRDLREILLVPPGGSRGRELIVFLHGYTQPTAQSGQWIAPVLRKLGTSAPAVLLVDDGDLTSWWHDRVSGKWGSYVLREAIPAALRRTGADPRRIAIGGISMGGFGSLDLARLAPKRFCAVGGHSPAILPAQYLHSANAFDDAADFARHDLLGFGASKQLYAIPVYIDVGRADPLRYPDQEFAESLRAHGTDVTFRLVPGGHSGWAARVPTYLRWYVQACS